MTTKCEINLSSGSDGKAVVSKQTHFAIFVIRHRLPGSTRCTLPNLCLPMDLALTLNDFLFSLLFTFFVLSLVELDNGIYFTIDNRMGNNRY